MVVEFFPTIGGFYGLVEQWRMLGVFNIFLPLILVFSVVFAILEKVNLFKNRAVHLIISLVIGFFTIANPVVSSFFMPLFSNLAIGVGVILVLIVLLGIALKKDQDAFKWIFGIAGGLIFLVVIGKTGLIGSIGGESFKFFIYQNLALVILIVFIIIVVIAVLVGSSQKDEIKFKLGSGNR